MHDWLIFHVGSGQAFFSGIFLIQLAGFSAFMKRGRWLAFGRVVSACAGMILVAISSTPLPVWFYAAAGAITLGWLGVDGFTKTARQQGGLALRFATLAVGWIGVALEAPFHLMPAIPQLQSPQVFLVGDSLSAGIDRVTETWPKVFSRSHHVVIHDLALAGADVTTAMLQAKQVTGPASLVLAEIGGNDVLRANRPEDFEQGLDVLLAKLREDGRTVVMLELPLPPFHNRYGEVQRRLAKRHGVLLIPKRILMGVLTTAGATVDRFHLSPAGHALFAETVWGIIGQAVGPGD
jgi:acyl-CoA thioesterase I